MSPDAFWKPVRSAAPLPWLMAWNAATISGWRLARSFITSAERSREPSSTMTTSSSRPQRSAANTRLTTVSSVFSSL